MSPSSRRQATLRRSALVWTSARRSKVKDHLDVGLEHPEVLDEDEVLVRDGLGEHLGVAVGVVAGDELEDVGRAVPLGAAAEQDRHRLARHRHVHLQVDGDPK